MKVKTARPVEGTHTLTGTIVAADQDGVRLATEGGERSVAFEDVASARTVFEWGAKGRAK